ncbi:MAG TPA: hypothetical protein VMM92_07240 [Thermoanaerobaculia bacterium]|nr:hypothetical protein [Thermoanaerobaculia bacterium]
MRTARSLVALLCLAGLLALLGCQPHTAGDAAPSAATAPPPATSDAEKTRELERKAADIEKRAASIKDMVGSEQEKIDAANQLERERQEMANQAEGGQEPRN